MDKSRLITQTQVLKNKVSKMYEIVGESEAIRSVKEMIDRVAPTEARVLITGANGTGKNLLHIRYMKKAAGRRDHLLRSTAQLFHLNSLKVNCSAMKKDHSPLL